MNKHIVEVLKEYDFSFTKRHGYGHINGYEVNVLNVPVSNGPIFLFSTYLTPEKKHEFILKMNSYKFKLVQSDAFEFGVVVMIGAMTYKSFQKKFEEILSKILETLELLEAPKSDICPQSGEVIDELNCQLTLIPDSEIKIRLSREAVSEINAQIEESNQEFVDAPNNYLKGFLGILIGAIVGSIAMGALGMIGYVTIIAPLISIFLGVHLYKKFGGKENITMIIMSLITTIVVMFGTLVIVYISTATATTRELGLNLTGFKALSHCLNNDAAFKRGFIGEFVINGIFIVEAEGYALYSLLKMIKRPKNIE